LFCPECNQFTAPGEDRCGHCGAVIGAAGAAPPDARTAGEAGEGSGQEPGAYFTGTGVRDQAPDDRYPWPGRKGFGNSSFQQAVTWLVGHLWWVIGGIAALLALVALLSGPGAWDLVAGLILLLLAGFSLLRRGWRRLPLAVLLVAVAVALFSVGGRAVLNRRPAAVQTPPGTAGTQATPVPGSNSSITGMAWRKTVSLPQSPVGLGQGPPGRMWVFEARRPGLPVDGLALVDEAGGATVFSKSLGTTAGSYTVDSGGGAWVAEDGNGRVNLLAFDPANQKVTSYPLPASITNVVGLADSSEGMWLVVQGPETGLAATRFDPETGNLTPFASVSPSVQPVQVAGTPAGRLWVVLQQSGQLVSVGQSGTVRTYASWPGKLGQVAADGENCYVTGYAPGTASNVHVLYYEYGRPSYVDDFAVGGTADMPGGVAWSPGTETVFAGFSAIGGGHGLPGVWERRGVSSGSLMVPLGGLPGGGVGPVLPVGNDVWLGLPFSRALILMSAA